MKTLKIILISIITTAIVGATVFFVIGYFKPKPGGIRVETSSPASVYVNGAFVGKSPFKGNYKAGDVTLKIVPDTSGQSLLAFETKLSVTSGIETVVRREFAATEEESSGDIISFEKSVGGDTSLVVVSTPDNAQVSIDGVPRGFAPYKSSTISPAEHQITVKTPGYVDRVMTVKVISGFRLNVFAKLGKAKATEPVATPLPTVRTYIEILPTPTGFLRVRTAPGSAGEEIAQVKPGERYLFLDEDAVTGWYKIQYEPPAPGLPNGISGWVSKEFAKKVEGDGKEATPSANLNTSG